MTTSIYQTTAAALLAAAQGSQSPGKTQLFRLGNIVCTLGAASVLPPELFSVYLDRHQAGDWGNVCEDDKALNDLAVGDGSRILSAYPINPDLPCKGFGENCVWVITEADRSVTTFLLPEEY
jgi:hypothetical protein